MSPQKAYPNIVQQVSKEIQCLTFFLSSSWYLCKYRQALESLANNLTNNLTITIKAPDKGDYFLVIDNYQYVNVYEYRQE